MVEKRLTIGVLAKAAGVNVETIRFYEREGVIKQPSKGAGSFRIYSQHDAIRIRFIKRAQGLGFTLGEITELFKFERNSKISCSQLKSRVSRKIQELEEKIEDLRKMKTSLSELSNACDQGKSSVEECRVSECFEPRGEKSKCCA